jgi:hypothetical protein
MGDFGAAHLTVMTTFDSSTPARVLLSPIGISEPLASARLDHPREVMPNAVLDGHHYRAEPEEVVASMKRYSPQGNLGEWVSIRDFVFDAAVLTAASTTYSVDRVLKVSSLFVRWAVAEQGVPMDAGAVFARHVIEIYCSTLDLSDGTVATYRSLLIAVADVVAPEENPERFTPLARRKIKPPYSDLEMRKFRSWATGQKTETGIHKAKVMLSLSAGAGLWPAEIKLVQPEDIVADDLGVTVQVRGDVPRTVPVLHTWEQWALSGAAARPAGTPLWGAIGKVAQNKNLLTEFTSKSIGISPTNARLRATWIVTHLSLGTPMKALVRAGGMTQFGNLHHYLEYVEDVTETTYRATLRGESKS